MLHLTEPVSHQEKKGSNQAWHMCRHNKNHNNLLLLFTSTASSQGGFCTGEGYWCALKSKTVFHELCRCIASYGSTFFCPLSNFWNTEQTKTLEGQTYKYFNSLYIGYSFGVKRWSKADTACILPVTGPELHTADPGSSNDYQLQARLSSTAKPEPLLGGYSGVLLKAASSLLACAKTS